MQAISIERRATESTLAVVRALPPQPSCSAERTVAAALAHVLMMFGVKHGLDPDALCAAAGFRTADLADRDRQVPYAWFASLARELSERVPHACLAAEVARFAVLDQFGYLGQAVKHAGTPLEALQLLVRYARWLDSTLQSHELAIVCEGDHVQLIVPEVTS